jgi:hypothetical protein
MPENNLRGRIVAMYHSVKNFAKVIKWSNRKAYDIVNGKQTMTGKDIDEMCQVLNVCVPEEMRSLFFSR